MRSRHGQRAFLGYHDPSSGPLSGHNERDLFPNLAVFGSSVEFDHLPRLCLDLHTVGEGIHRHHGGQDRPCPLARGAAGAGPLLLTGLDVDQRVGGDVHLDDLAILVRDVPGVWDAFDMYHGGAQRLPKGAGHDQQGDGEDDPEQAQRARCKSPYWDRPKKARSAAVPPAAER